MSLVQNADDDAKGVIAIHIVFVRHPPIELDDIQVSLCSDIPEANAQGVQ